MAAGGIAVGEAELLLDLRLNQREARLCDRLGCRPRLLLGEPTIVSRLMSRARGEGPLATLSAREQSILTLIAEGRSDEAITQHLGVTAEVYEAELRDVFAKLGLSGTPDDLRRVVAVLGYLSSTVQDASTHGKTKPHSVEDEVEGPKRAE